MQNELVGARELPNKVLRNAPFFSRFFFFADYNAVGSIPSVTKLSLDLRHEWEEDLEYVKGRLDFGWFFRAGDADSVYPRNLKTKVGIIAVP